MPARRLFESPRDQPGRLSVPVPDAALPTSKSRACGLVACLSSALQVCAAPAQYAELMGLLNAAFMLRVDEQFAVKAVVEGRWHRLVDVLHQLGFREAHLHQHPIAPEVVTRELREGRPLVALEWGGEAVDWSLVCGQSARSGHWWGYQFGLRPTMAEWQPQCRMALTLGSQTAPPDYVLARVGAVAAAAGLPGSKHDPVSRYHKWAEMLRRDDLVPVGGAGDAMFRRHEWLVEVLLDARAAAVDFLQTIAEDATAEADLLHAADMYLRVIDVLESRDSLFYAELGCEVFRDSDHRGEWADLLTDAAEIEACALAVMRRLTQ